MTPANEYPEWLRAAASKGGSKSRRTLTKAQARKMVKARVKKRAALKRLADGEK